MTLTATAEPQQRSGTEHLDVLVIGAGVSGIGAAHRLRTESPERSFAVLEAQDARGGTWWTHQFPGARSDSDLFTYGYRHKPWRGASIRRGRRDPVLPRRGHRRGRPHRGHPLPPHRDRAGLVL